MSIVFNLKKKILTLTILLGLSGLVSIMIAFSVYSGRFESEIISQTSQLVNSTSNLLSLWVEQQIGEIRKWSEMELVAMSVRETIYGYAKLSASNVLEETQHRHPDYEYLAMASLENGEIRCHSAGVLSARAHSYRDFLGDINLKEMDFFKISSTGTVSASQVILSKKSGNPVMIISVPVFQKEGNKETVIGVFFGLLEITSFIKQHIDTIQIGEQGFAVLLNQNGPICASQEKSRIFLSDNSQFDWKQQINKEQEILRPVLNNTEYIIYFKTEKTTGWSVAMVLIANDVFRSLHDFRNILWMTTLATFVMIICFSWLFSLYLTRPINRIVGSVRTIASGELDTSVPIGGKDEIGQLAMDVDKMRLAIKEMTEELKEQERLKNEMELARRIQTSLLPVLTDEFHPDFQIAASMLTADDVGGDFYDINLDRSGHLWIAVGDVSGHGITPGLIMMMAQTAHTTIADNLDCDARELVIKINRLLYTNVHERLKEKHFMTFNALKYLGDGRFEHAGAHLRIIVFRRKLSQCELIRTKGVYLNLKKDISKAVKKSYFELEKGDVMVLYTDGLTEAENPDGEMLDIGRFSDIVQTYAHQSPEVMKENIMNRVLNWCHNTRDDDMTLLIVKRKESPC